MRHFIFTTVLLIATSNSHFMWAQSENNKIVIGTIDSIQSAILNEERKLWIYVPDSEPGSLYSQQKYPVVFLLDGDGHFSSVMSMIDYLGGETVIPKMMIVGIPNTNRWRDLTPSKWEPDSTEQISIPPFAGGGEAFTSFLETELIPYIDSNYPTAPHRMMIGHSLGGLMVINTLLYHSHLFHSYLAIDPSLWWDDNLLSRQADSIFQHKSFEGKSLYLAMANNTGLPEDIDIYSVLTDTAESAVYARDIVSFANVLKSTHGHGLRWKFQFYPHDMHTSVPFIAEYDAMRFLFDKYMIPFSFIIQLENPEFNVLAGVMEHYHAVSEQMGYTVLPPENFVNSLGYNMIHNGDMERAFNLFDLNVRNYPDSYNVYDSMGDYYVAMNDNMNAIEFFTKTLKLKDVAGTREKLEKLKAMMGMDNKKE